MVSDSSFDTGRAPCPTGKHSSLVPDSFSVPLVNIPSLVPRVYQEYQGCQWQRNHPEDPEITPSLYVILSQREERHAKDALGKGQVSERLGTRLSN